MVAAVCTVLCDMCRIQKTGNATLPSEQKSILVGSGVGVHFKRTGNNYTITFSIFSCLLGCYDFMQAISRKQGMRNMTRCAKPAKGLIK